MNIDNIPQEMKDLKQWVNWAKKGTSPGDRGYKAPYHPVSGNTAKAGIPDTWGGFEAAYANIQAGGFQGIGFEFADNGGFVGIDLDHVLKNGELVGWAQDIVDIFDSYTEVSPSGTGLHILVKGSVPKSGKKKKIEGDQALELYQSRRYFTVTGNVYGETKPIEPRQQELDELWEELFSTHTPQQAPAPLPADDFLQTGLEKDEKLRAYWGGYRPTGDESGNDQAFMNKLAYWCNKDIDRMIAAFLASPYAQQKDDAHQKKAQREDYLRRTAEKAIADTTSTAAEDHQQFQHKRAKEAFSNSELAELHPEKNDRYRWNDIGNGNLFADWYKDKARYVPDRKQWFVYNGKVWKPDTAGLKVMQMCKKLADKLTVYALSIQDESQKQAYMKHVAKWQVRRNRETILKDAASVHPVQLIEFDADPMLFNCLNGTIDLRTREFRPHNPNDLLSKISGVKYDYSASYERWERFMNEVMQGDQERIVFLQKAFGYTLTGETWFECLFVLYGATTRNGKSTTMETYLRMMGDYGRTAKPETLAMKPTASSNIATEDIARLAGARLVNISEPGKELVLNAALVKTLTGTDTITARFLHENSFEFQPHFKLFINTNHLPKVTDVTLFSSGRVKAIPFERHFTEAEQDPHLKKELAKPENLSGLLNWCLEGLWLLMETGFDVPLSVQEATKEYQELSDKIGRFIEDTLEPDPQGEIRTEELYTMYKTWCALNNYCAQSAANFKADMSNYAVIKRKRPNGSGRETGPQSLLLGYKRKCVPGCAGFYR
nr:phage/plasmid primase, P4 family [uncultured Solibaculum sp.]